MSGAFRKALAHPKHFVNSVRMGLRREGRGLRQRANGWYWYRLQLDEYLAAAAAAGDTTELRHTPCPYDHLPVQAADPTYYYQDCWAFEKIVAAKPDRHVDIGSHHKLVALLSMVVPTVEIDIRRPSILWPTVEYRQGSILDLPYEDGSVESLSSMCVIEHIGLGRYGDPIDPHGTDKALAELKRVLAPGGNLYLSMPVDDEDRVYFNAHRARRDETWKAQFAPLELIEARYIVGQEFCERPGKGFGTGCYHVRKPSPDETEPASEVSQ